MLKPMKYLEEIKNLSFAHDTLKIKKNDLIEYSVIKGVDTMYKNIYNSTENFVVIQIHEADIESPPLYSNQSFIYRFRKPGVYNIYCLNYPKMRQTVIVEDKNHVDNICSNLKHDKESRIISSELNSSISADSETDIFSCLNSMSNSELNHKNKTFHRADKRTSVFSIKRPFNNSLRSRKVNLTKTFDKPKYERLIDTHDITNNNYTKTLPKTTCNIKYDTDELYRINGINQLSPKSLQNVFTTLKLRYKTNFEDQHKLTFKNFDEVALHCKSAYGRSLPRSNFNNRTVVNKAINNIQKRFK